MYIVVGERNAVVTVCSENVADRNIPHFAAAGEEPDCRIAVIRIEVFYCYVLNVASGDFAGIGIVTVYCHQVVIRGTLDVADSAVAGNALNMHTVHIRSQHIMVKGNMLNREVISIAY